MNRLPTLVPMKARHYQKIPVHKIKVLNPRNRDADQFAMNVTSIDQNGLIKPIIVNDKYLQRTGRYELVFGQGRLLAYIQLKRATIPAQVLTCDRKEAYLQSLVENLARTRPCSMDYARELKNMHDQGFDYAQIARVACKGENHIREYIRLVEQGEERLIHGVEQGVFPITFATQVASADNGQLQHVLMDAFDEGLVTTENFAQARRLIMARARTAKDKNKAGGAFTVEQLKQDVTEATRTQLSYVREVQNKESRFVTLLTGINKLWQDPYFVHLLRQENLHHRPALVGDFTYDTGQARPEEHQDGA